MDDRDSDDGVVFGLTVECQQDVAMDDSDSDDSVFFWLPVECQQAILAFVDFPSLIALRSTCKALRILVAEELRRSFIAILALFVEDTTSLSRILVECNAIVSGSMALRMIDRDGDWDGYDLDIFVGKDRFRELLDGLERARLAAVKYLSEPRDDYPGLVRQVVSLEGRRGRIIQIVCSVDNSSMSPLAAFWTTLLRNFVTPFGLVVGYPMLTLSRRGVLAGRHTELVHKLNRRKYERRGFDFRAHPQDWVDIWHASQGMCLKDGYMCPNEPRYFGDGGTLIAPFSPISGLGAWGLVRRAPFGWSRSWILGGDTCDSEACSGPSMPSSDMIAVLSTS